MELLFTYYSQHFQKRHSYTIDEDGWACWTTYMNSNDKIKYISTGTEQK